MENITMEQLKITITNVKLLTTVKENETIQKIQKQAQKDINNKTILNDIKKELKTNTDYDIYFTVLTYKKTYKVDNTDYTIAFYFTIDILEPLHFDDTILLKKKHIKISSNTTVFIDTKYNNFLEPKQLLKQVKSIRKQLKDDDVKLLKSDTIQFLNKCIKNENNFIDEFNKYNDSYEKLFIGWKIILNKDNYNIYDDAVFKELEQLKFKITEQFFSNKVLGMYSNLQYDIENLKMQIDAGHGFVAVAV